MHTLILADFASPSDAEAARQDLLGLATEYMPDVADAVIVSVDRSGTFHLNQMVNLWTTEGCDLSLMRLMHWVLFVQPLLDVAVAGQSAGLRDALSDFGIPPDFTAALQLQLKPGHAVLALMPRTQTAAFVSAGLNAPYKATETDGLFDANLRAALIGAIATIRKHHTNVRGISA